MNWFTLLHPAIQGMIVLVVAGLISFITMLFVRAGIKADIKNGKISFRNNKYNENNIEKYIIKYAKQKLSTLRASIESHLYELLMQNGVKKEYLTEHPDLQLLKEILRNMIYANDEWKSTIKLIEDFLIDGKFYELTISKYETFIDDVIKAIFEKWNEYLNLHYPTHIISQNGTTIERTISREKLFDYAKTKKAEIKEIIKDIFDEAKEIYIKNQE